MTVRPLNDFFIASNYFFSVTSSTELVGSSIIRQTLSCKIALARHNNCFCPLLKLSPELFTIPSVKINNKYVIKIYNLTCL